MNTISRRLLLACVSIILLACGMPVTTVLITPTNEVQTETAQIPTSTVNSVPDPSVEMVTIKAVTKLNIRSCGSLACEPLFQVDAGTALYSACSSSGWCFWTGGMRPGYFCREAAEGVGGCEIVQTSQSTPDK